MNLMRLFILLCCITLLSGCASFGDNRRCEIRGKPFQGIFPLVKDSANTTKVMMVHGVGKHIPSKPAADKNLYRKELKTLPEALLITLHNELKNMSPMAIG